MPQQETNSPPAHLNTPSGSATGSAPAAPLRDLTVTGLHNMFLSLERLSGGLLTGLAALFTLFFLAAVALTCLVGVGLLLVPAALRLLRTVANWERERLLRWGAEIIHPYCEEVARGPLRALGSLRHDVQVRRNALWLVCHSVLGLPLGLFGVLLPIIAVRDATFPLWWHLLPPNTAGASVGLPVHGWSGALAVGFLGLAWCAIMFGLSPALARLQGLPGTRLLGSRSQTVLTERIHHLTATRAAALQAHTRELRRIERSLHDGTQNRLVAVTILLGAARRAVRTRPERADEALEQAQAAAEDALAEMRGLIRSILPPALEKRGLEGALNALASGCSVPCAVAVRGLGRYASSVEATAYFVVAEAITNITRHSEATRARVSLTGGEDRLHIEVHDDGRGGAQEGAGTGLAGIRTRVEAHDGSLTVTSPVGGPTLLHAELPCAS